jgi:putative salt-induced outer membrane protein YdiY
MPLAFAFVLAQLVPKPEGLKTKTDITTEGFVSAARPYEEDGSRRARELNVAGGGMIASGNSKLLAITGAFLHRSRRFDDQISSGAAVNYGRAATSGAQATEATVENVQARIRYDRFFATDWTAFIGLQGRNDRFAGLVARNRVDPGIGYFFVNTPFHSFWTEVGYDLLHDIRREDAREPVDDNGKPIPGAARLPKTSTIHSGRLFLGYRYKIREGVAIAAGLEYLQGISDPGIQRVNGEAVVMSKFSDSLSIANTFAFRYDDRPLPGKQPLDLSSSVSLVYHLK